MNIQYRRIGLLPLFPRDRLILSRFQACRKLSKSSTKTVKKASQPIRKPQKPQLEYKPRPKVPPPPPPAPPVKDKMKYRRHPLYVAMVMTFCLTGYVTYFYIQINKSSSKSAPTEASSQPDVSSRYDKIAKTFDKSVDSMESMMGMTKKRGDLVSQAHGDVLEVSIGTGRNLEYYDFDFKGSSAGQVNAVGGVKKGKVRSFTAIDKSGEMLELAHEKFSEMFPGILGVRWIIGDASEEIPSPPKNANERSGNLEGRKYDTVVQTMGLCSADDPVKLLRNLGKCVKEEEGRILLLEHGRGRWDWVNKILDKTAEGHANEHGCWWNRDIGEIIKESGLEIVHIETWHAGTTWRIELKKPVGN